MRIFALLFCLVGCTSVPDVQPWSGAPDGGGNADRMTFPPPDVVFSLDDDTPPTVTILTPSQGEAVEASPVIVSGTASDNLGLASVQVRVGDNVLVPAISDDFYLTWHAELPLPPGTWAITARAVDLAGNAAEDRIDATGPGSTDDTEPPSLDITQPAEGLVTARADVVVEGTASDDVAVSRVEVMVEGLEAVTLAQSADGFAHFFALVDLLPGRENHLTIRALDQAGRATEVTRTVVSGSRPQGMAPTLDILEPPEGAEIPGDTVVVRGTASDDHGLVAVEARADPGAYQGADSEDGYLAWSVTLGLRPGDNIIYVRALDVEGLETTITRNVRSVGLEGWGEPRVYRLRPQPPDEQDLVFTLDRHQVADVVAVETQRQITLMYMDPAPIIRSTLDQLKGSCGEGWRYAGFEPHCPPEWRPQEINMWRLVTMTPDNVDVTGTSIEEMRGLSDSLAAYGLLDDFSDILSQSLGIARTDEIIGAEYVAQSFVTNLVATHPNTTDEGEIPVTMEDGLTDMATLGPRFGPVGDHPGFMDPEAPTSASVMGEDFRQTLVARSNLRWHEGVDLSWGKEFMALLEGEDVLEFDFMDPQRFWIEGLVESPTASLTFVLSEHPDWLPVGASPEPLPRGNSVIWQAEPWTLEYIIDDGAFIQYQARQAGCELCPGAAQGAFLYEIIGVDAAEIVVGRSGYDDDGDGVAEHFPLIDPNPPGWLRIWTLLDLGTPPQPQYIWDMITEMAERRLRDGGVAEGEGLASFNLTGIDVGLEGSEVADLLRPVLEEQKSSMSELLMGDYAINNGALDLYLANGEGGEAFLFFVAPEDPRPLEDYGYTAPGFYWDEELTMEASTTDDLGSGDRVHRKVRVSPEGGEVYYIQDDEGGLFRLEMGAKEGEEVVLTVWGR